MVSKRHTGTGKTMLHTFITTYGLFDNEYKQQLADNEVSMDALFGEGGGLPKLGPGGGFNEEGVNCRVMPLVIFRRQ